MRKYYVNHNEQPEGEHEVHDWNANCSHPPLMQNRVDLGYHATCRGAIFEAQKLYPYSHVNGCAYCVPLCNSD